MLRTFEDLISDFKILSRDTSDANDTFARVTINKITNRILAMGNWTTNRGSSTVVSIAGDNVIRKPWNAGKIIGMKIMVDEVPYIPKEVHDRDTWNTISRSTTSSDYIQYYFIERDHIELYPYFSRSALDVTTYYQKVITSRSASDYTTGTVGRSAISRTVLGTGTTFTWDMEGRYISFDDDEEWYEISDFIDTTTLYTARASRTASDDQGYKISEIIPLPNGFEDLPVYAALEQYFQQKENPQQAQYWGNLYREELNQLTRSDATSTGNVLTKGITKGDAVNPNDYPLSME